VKAKRKAEIWWAAFIVDGGPCAANFGHIRRRTKALISQMSLPECFRAAKVAVIELTPDNVEALRKAGFNVKGGAK
jgi:hypothetical protein